MSSVNQSPRTVACPKCGARVVWVETSTYRPFCSARCKGIDLGAWASEQYRVATTEETDDQDGHSTTPSHSD